MYDIPRTKVSSPAPRGERTPCSPRQRAPLRGTLRTDCGLLLRVEGGVPTRSPLFSGRVVLQGRCYAHC